MPDQKIQIIECPRDAMQGWHKPIPTYLKIDYIQALLAVGFDIIDAGSFVHPKLVPQMADTAAVFEKLDLSSTPTKLLAIVGNRKGALDAIRLDILTYIGYPFSLSPTFMMRNIHKTVEESLVEIEGIQKLCLLHGKTLVLYLSMAFGNPFHDPYDPHEIPKWISYFNHIGISHFSLADTTAEANTSKLKEVYETLVPFFTGLQLGLHLHAHRSTMVDLCEASLELGFNRFEVSLGGIGGCPFAKQELVGNLDTMVLINVLKEKNKTLNIDEQALRRCYQLQQQVFY